MWIPTVELVFSSNSYKLILLTKLDNKKNLTNRNLLVSYLLVLSMVMLDLDEQKGAIG